MLDIKFIGEDDFLSTMQTENEAWLRNSVTQGTHRSFDGTRLNYYKTTPEKPKATVVIVHGMAEFFPKYREYMWYLYQWGFEVFFLEQRGFGHSEGKCPEHDVIYIDSYDTYVEDLHGFIKEKVIPVSGGRPLFMIAHSMGGCIGTLYLEQHPKTFNAAILSSPMLKMKGVDFPPAVVELISLYANITGQKKKLAPNQKHFNPNPEFVGSSTQSRARFDYQLQFRRDDPDYQMTGASFGWAMASLRATKKLMENASHIHIPITLMAAGDDHLVETSAFRTFKARVPQLNIHEYEYARHELFNSDERSRRRYFRDVLNTLDSYIC